MAERSSRIVYRPLQGWPEPIAEQVFTPFTAPWSSTADLVCAEADHLGAALVVVELDVDERDFRQDGQMRKNARIRSEKVRVSVESPSRGSLSWRPGRYRLMRGGQDGWRENVRAVALTMQALRAVDRYGAVHTGEQYRGFAALEARATGSFSSPDEALRWMWTQVGAGGVAGSSAYRELARQMHPDAGGDPADWQRLDEARRLLEGTRLW